MIRVLYRWTVAPEDREDFIARWQQATRAIHETTAGALGSFCLGAIDKQDELMTIALWRSEAEWRAFMPKARTGPMAVLHRIGTLQSATPYDQLGDETVHPD